MTRRTLPRGLLICALFLVLMLAPVFASTNQRIIVRTNAGIDGLSAVRTACSLVGCTVLYGLDGPIGQLFLVTTASDADVLVYILPWLPVSAPPRSMRSCTRRHRRRTDPRRR